MPIEALSNNTFINFVSGDRIAKDLQPNINENVNAESVLRSAQNINEDDVRKVETSEKQETDTGVNENNRFKQGAETPVGANLDISL